MSQGDRRRLIRERSLAVRQSAGAAASNEATSLRRGHSRVVTVVVFTVLAVAGLAHMHGISRSSAYGVAAFTLLTAKLLASLRYRPTGATDGDRANDDLPATSHVAVIVPVYNEDPALAVSCLRSIMAQTRPPTSLHIIDDGSADLAARTAIEALLPELRSVIADVRLTVFAENRGKREAQAVGIREARDADVIVTIDSDTILDRHALAEGVKPLADPKVAAVTGFVRALNHDRNLLTRLLDLRYANSFLYERAAYSLAGAVLCCCGTLAFYRAEVLREHLHDFVNQRFLGQPATYGDDRRLTNYALQHGKVVLQDTAVGYTAVPERFSHFLRQQIRWNKSFFRESLWATQNLPLRSPALALSLLELASWATFSLLLGYSLLVRPFTAGASVLLAFLLYMAVMSYARSVRYLQVRHDGQDARSHTSVFLLAPVYGLLHIFLLVPLRFYSLATLGSGTWGTRAKGVEVAVDAASA